MANYAYLFENDLYNLIYIYILLKLYKLSCSASVL